MVRSSDMRELPEVLRERYTHLQPPPATAATAAAKFSGGDVGTGGGGVGAGGDAPPATAEEVSASHRRDQLAAAEGEAYAQQDPSKVSTERNVVLLRWTYSCSADACSC